MNHLDGVDIALSERPHLENTQIALERLEISIIEDV